MTKDEVYPKYERLIYKVAHSLHRSYPYALEYQEKVSVAYEGLVRAAELYDPDKGALFFTYAKKAMTNRCLKAIYEEMRSVAPCSKNNDRTKYGIVHTTTFQENTNYLDGDGGGPEWAREMYRVGAYHFEDPTDRIHFDRAVTDIVRKLTEEQASIFCRHFLHGKTLEEIGEELGMSRQLVHKRISPVLRKYNLYKRRGK